MYFKLWKDKRRRSEKIMRPLKKKDKNNYKKYSLNQTCKVKILKQIINKHRFLPINSYVDVFLLEIRRKIFMDVP